MPIYEYDCPKCGRFDVLQRMSDKPLRTHDTCGSKVHKVMSASAFAFKGSGFYATDYKKDAKSPKKDARSPASCDKPKTEACSTCPASDGKAA